MRTFDRRLNKLEQEFGVGSSIDSGYRVMRRNVVVMTDRDLSQEQEVEVYIESLDLPANAFSVVNLEGGPGGLTATEIDRFLRNRTKDSQARTPYVLVELE